VLLHTEVIREHLLVDPGTWTLSGRLDFETAMTGDRTLRHRHSNLPECLSQLPAPPEPTLDSLAQTWFGIA